MTGIHTKWVMSLVDKTFSLKRQSQMMKRSCYAGSRAEEDQVLLMKLLVVPLSTKVLRRSLEEVI